MPFQCDRAKNLGRRQTAATRQHAMSEYQPVSLWFGEFVLQAEIKMESGDPNGWGLSLVAHGDARYPVTRRLA